MVRQHQQEMGRQLQQEMVRQKMHFLVKTGNGSTLFFAHWKWFDTFFLLTGNGSTHFSDNWIIVTQVFYYSTLYYAITGTYVQRGSKFCFVVVVVVVVLAETLISPCFQHIAPLPGSLADILQV
jgi:hypothetical protein